VRAFLELLIMRMLIEVMGLLLLRFVSLKVDELDRIVIGNVEDVVYVIDEIT